MPCNVVRNDGSQNGYENKNQHQEQIASGNSKNTRDLIEKYYQSNKKAQTETNYPTGTVCENRNGNQKNYSVQKNNDAHQQTRQAHPLSINVDHFGSSGNLEATLDRGTEAEPEFTEVGKANTENFITRQKFWRSQENVCSTGVSPNKGEISILKIENLKIMQDYKALEKENKEIKRLLDSLYQEVEEKGKSASVFASIWNTVTAKKKTVVDLDTVTKVRHITGYIHTLREKHSYELTARQKFEADVAQLRREYEDLKGRYAKQQNNHNQELSKKIDSIAHYERELQSCKKQLTDKWNEIAQHLRNNHSLGNELVKQKAYALQLQNEKRDRETQNTAKIQKLKDQLLQTDKNFQEATKQIEELQAKLQEVDQQRQQLTKVLNRLINRTEAQRKTLDADKEEFENNLDEVSVTIAKVCQSISPERVAEEADHNFVENAVMRIYEILSDAKEYEQQINNFQGSHGNKLYLNIKEMLTRDVESLDAVESRMKEKIQTERRSAVSYVKRLLAELENKVNQ